MHPGSDHRAMRAALALSLVTSMAIVGIPGSRAVAQPLIVLDAGHGGSDPGAVGCSIQEADAVLDVTQRLQVLLEAAGVRIALTRSDDTFVELSARAAFANSRGAEGFFSVHSNANSGAPASGTETFVYPGAGTRTRALGQGIQDAMIAAWMLPDRGLKEGNYAVLRETSMPAALGELGFTNRCDRDALLLADPAARRTMAEHQRDAILEWLGIDPTTTVGTIRGVVFEDQGVGAEDVTVRLDGATVRVVETGATATVAAPDAAFSFSLPPGAYTLEAAHDGHVTATRACTVAAGMTVDCPIGLLSVPTEQDGGVVPEVDAGTGVDGGPGVDAGPGREPVAGCGCAVGTRSERGWLALVLAIVALVTLRRRRAVLAVLALAGCAHDAGHSEAEVTTAPPRESAAIAAPITVTLGAPREWLAEGYADPVLSPDGARVAIASADHRALFVAELGSEHGFREVCRVGLCGWAPRWQGDRELAYRIAGQSGTAVPGEAIAVDTMVRAPVTAGERGVHVWTDDEDRAWLRHEGRTLQVSPEGARVMMPSIAGEHVVMWDLHEGVLAYRIADGTIARLGGGHPSSDPDGRWVVLERTEDDGHELTRSDLWIVDLRDHAMAPLVVSDAVLERAPSLSRIDASGRGTLAYLADGALVVRSIEVRR